MKKVDFRLISSTKRDLKKEVKNGNFREDLFYRINQIEISVPPLRERKDDIILLFSAFMNEFCVKDGKGFNYIGQSNEGIRKLQLAGECQGTQKRC